MNRLMKVFASWVTGKKFEIIFGILMFLFMLAHRSYLGLKAGLYLLPITILALPVFAVLVSGFWLPRKKWVIFLLLAVIFFYAGIRIYRGNDNLGPNSTGDRDDAVTTLASGLTNAKSLIAHYTYLGNQSTIGPVSGLMALPFVWFFGSNNVLSFIFFLALIGAFYHRRKPYELPFLGVIVGFLVFHPNFNWCYWEAGEEVLYGWAFIFSAVWLIGRIFDKENDSSARIAVFSGMLLGLAVGVRISYAIPALFLLLVLVFSRKIKEFFYALSAAAGVFFLACLPYVLFSSFEQFFSQWFFKIWIPKSGAPALPLLFFVVVAAWLGARYKVSIKFGVIVTVVAGHIYAGLFLVPWHVYYWILPVLFWLPDFGQWVLEKTANQRLLANKA